MNETLLWILVVFFLILFAVVLYLIVSIPMYFHRKKEKKYFSELAQKYNFEQKIGKVGLPT